MLVEIQRRGMRRKKEKKENEKDLLSRVKFTRDVLYMEVLRDRR